MWYELIKSLKLWLTIDYLVTASILYILFFLAALSALWVHDAGAAEPVPAKWARVQDWFNQQTYTEKAISDAEFTKLLVGTNQRINQRRYQSDKGDHWKTPAEFRADDGGDCEDYVIAKMDALARAGIPLESMELLIVKRNQLFSHALLAVQRGGGTMLLDNQSDLPTVSLSASYRIVYRIVIHKVANRVYATYDELERVMSFNTMGY
jgi:predicted transglutaminase-like cysteine proteinase